MKVKVTIIKDEPGKQNYSYKISSWYLKLKSSVLTQVIKWKQCFLFSNGDYDHELTCPNAIPSKVLIVATHLQSFIIITQSLLNLVSGNHFAIDGNCDLDPTYSHKTSKYNFLSF